MRPLCSLLLLCALVTLPVHAQTVPDPCVDQARVTAALRRAFRALGEAEPAARAALRDCARVVACGSTPAPTRAACTTQLMPEEWGFRVTVVPRAATGAPGELHVNVDTQNDTAHQVVVSGNRWAVGRQVAILGETEHRRHTHGGAPARIAWARFHVWNDSGAALPLEVLDGVFLNNALETPLPAVHSQVTSLPPGESELEVGFTVQDAYQSWNNHFAARFRLRVGRQVLTPQAEFAVMRVEPLQH